MIVTDGPGLLSHSQSLPEVAWKVHPLPFRFPLSPSSSPQTPCLDLPAPSQAQTQSPPNPPIPLPLSAQETPKHLPAPLHTLEKKPRPSRGTSNLSLGYRLSALVTPQAKLPPAWMLDLSPTPNPLHPPGRGGAGTLTLKHWK